MQARLLSVEGDMQPVVECLIGLGMSSAQIKEVWPRRDCLLALYAPRKPSAPGSTPLLRSGHARCCLSLP